VQGETSLALAVVAAVLAWSMYGRVPVPEIAPRGSLVTNAARQ
jgi:NADH-quinone oxidoreductase subunit L